VVPLIMIQSASGAPTAAAAPRVERASSAPPPKGYFPAWQLAADRIKGGSTPAETTADVTQSAVPSTVPPAPVAPPTTTTEPPPTTTEPPTTTTTEPPPTTTEPPPPAAADTPAAARRTGVVTYYDDPGGPGTCASPTLPFGTVVTVTNPANGATVECTVDDREDDTARQIDLDTASFAEIAPLSQGVVSDAELSW
jgi:hypothetical protein